MGIIFNCTPSGPAYQCVQCDVNVADKNSLVGMDGVSMRGVMFEFTQMMNCQVSDVVGVDKYDGAGFYMIDPGTQHVAKNVYCNVCNYHLGWKLEDRFIIFKYTIK